MKRASEKIHTHGEEKDFIDFIDFEAQVEAIKTAIDADLCHKEYLESIVKKVKAIKESVDSIMNQVVEAHKSDLQKVYFKLNKRYDSILRMVDNNTSSDKLTGKDVHDIFQSEECFY